MTEELTRLHANGLSEADRMRLTYNLACGLANRALEPKVESGSRPIASGTMYRVNPGRELDDLGAAEELTFRLLRSALRLRRFPPKVDGGVADLAESMIRPLVALLASIWAVSSRRSGDRAPQETTQVLDLLMIDEPVDIDEPVYGVDSTGKLEKKLDPILKRRAERPHPDLVELLGPLPELESPATAYAMACYYALAGPRHVDDAFRALSLAFVDRTLKAWAPDDPWLTALQDSHEERWTKVTGEQEKPKEPETLNVNLKVERRPKV